MSVAENADESGTSKNNHLKISLQSENTMTSAEDDDQDLEEVIWNLMGKSGLLTDLKSQILNFIQNYDQSSSGTNSERADAAIIAAIYEYLKWIGMKYSCAAILSESPVDLNDLIDSERQREEDEPLLCNMFKKSKEKDEIGKIFKSTPNIVRNNLVQPQENIPNATGDEIDSSAIDAFNKTYVASASVENQHTETVEYQTDKSISESVHDESKKNIHLNESTFDVPRFEASKETGDSLISGGDVLHNNESKDKQDFSSIGKSDSDTFEEESLLELVEDLSIEKEKLAQNVPSAPSLIKFTESVNGFDDIKTPSDAKEIPDPESTEEENIVESHSQVISKETEEKSDSSLQINDDRSKNKSNEMSPPEKSESHHFEEESISELLEDLSLDNTEDITIPPEEQDINKDCDHVVKLS